VSVMPAGADLSVRLLRAFHEGEGTDPDRLFELLYDELLRLARMVRGGRGSDTLSTTALVHEAYVKLASADRVDVESRLHFFRMASRVMRQILVDAARGRLAEKRGGKLFPVTFDEALHAAPVPAARFLLLDRAIDRLAALDPRAAEVVECRYFGGLTVEETAHALEISPRTVKRDWRVARALLASELQAAEP
jgi:RNA polymerase sigma factor (TIGR02999 family)